MITVKAYLEYTIEGPFDAEVESEKIRCNAPYSIGAGITGLRALEGGKVIFAHFAPVAKTAPPSMPSFPGITITEEPSAAEILEEAYQDDPIDKAIPEAVTPERQYKYRTPEHYREVTGKRFRMTKSQKECGLSRSAAFKDFMKENDLYEMDN